MQKRIALLTLTIFLVLALAVPLWLIPRDPISQASVDAIQLGMSKDDVAAIIGRPAGYVDSSPKGEYTLPGETGQSWGGTDGSITVAYDSHGKVNFKHYQAGCREISFLDRIRNWLSW